MANVIIIGAGLTGLSTAYHLEQLGFYDYSLYEKEPTAGGLCRSIYQDGFTFDYTGHLLHSSDTYFSSFLETIMGPEAFNIINRRAYIYSHGVYTNFPFQSNLHGLPDTVIASAIEDFINRPKNLKANANFYEWAVHMFGKTITETFFVPYQQKIFAYDIHKLSSSWTGRFVPQTTLLDIVQGALRPRIMQTTMPDTSKVGYNSQFLYPKQDGIYFLIKELVNKITNPIKTSFCVESIDLKNKIVMFKNGDFEKFETLITTMPLDTLLSLTKFPAASSATQARKKLLCNSVINFNLGIQNPDLSDKHWVYLPESQFPHYRIGFYHNFSNALVPQGCSSVYGEYAYLNKDRTTVMADIQDAIKATQKLLGISDAQIITQRIIPISHAYVIYNAWRDKNLPDLLAHLASYNMHSIGRYGAWKYASMQEAVLDGRSMAKKLVPHAEPLPQFLGASLVKEGA